MTWVYTADGVTITRRFRDRPAKHWIQDDAESGHYVAVTDGNAAALGYYTEVVAPRPDNDHIRDGVGQPVGNEWQIGWVFDQTTADANAAAAAEEAERSAARAAVADLDAYIALDTPTNAETIAAVDHLAKACRRLIIDQYGDG